MAIEAPHPVLRGHPLTRAAYRGCAFAAPLNFPTPSSTCNPAASEQRMEQQKDRSYMDEFLRNRGVYSGIYLGAKQS